MFVGEMGMRKQKTKALDEYRKMIYFRTTLVTIQKRMSLLP